MLRLCHYLPTSMLGVNNDSDSGGEFCPRIHQRSALAVIGITGPVLQRFHHPLTPPSTTAVVVVAVRSLASGILCGTAVPGDYFMVSAERQTLLHRHLDHICHQVPLWSRFRWASSLSYLSVYGEESKGDDLYLIPKGSLVIPNIWSVRSL